MIIRKDAWHYKVYSYTYPKHTPERTTLCAYFWRILLGTPLMTLLYSAMIGVGIIIVAFVHLVFTPIGFVFGARPSHWMPLEDEFKFVSYRPFFSIGATGIYPWHLLFSWFAVWMLLRSDAGAEFPAARLLTLLATDAIMIVVGVIWHVATRRPEPKRDNLLFTFLRANKQRTCPIIEFRDRGVE